MKTRKSVLMAMALMAGPVFAQYPPQPMPQPMPPPRLDSLVARVALYPDGLLAQILAAATYPDQIPPAAQWADQHHYLSGEALARAMEADQLPWDPSVQALLPFPSVLQMMAADMNWTYDLGNAFLYAQGAVMDAVQRERHRAQEFGYLRSNNQIMVSGGPYIMIQPVNPVFMPVPYYDPAIVFYPPRRGIVIGGAIRFGFGVTIGVYYRPWGWGYGRFDWDRRVVIVNNAPWGRNWNNRGTYVHPYELRRPGPGPAPRVEDRHRLQERSGREYEAPQRGRRVEEHREGRGKERGRRDR